MNKRLRPAAISMTIALALVLAACGSTPEQEAAQVEVVEVVATTTTTVVPVAEEPDEVEKPKEAEVAETPATDPAIDPVLNSVIDELTAVTDLPLRLPSDLGADQVAGTEVFATVAAAEPGFYNVALGLEPGCTGNACTFGSLIGRRLDQEGDAFEGGVLVPLPNGQTGEFFDLTCGASCGEAYISWTEGDVQYTVGLKSNVEDVLGLAWDAHSPGATPPEAPQSCDGGSELEDDKHAAIIEDASIPGFYWYVLCRQNDVFVEVVNGPATLRALEPGVGELVAVGYGDGTTQLFRGTTAFINSDYREVPFSHRLVIGDLRCGSTGEHGNGIIDIVANAEIDGVFEAVERLGTPINHEGAIEIEALTAC